MYQLVCFVNLLMRRRLTVNQGGDLSGISNVEACPATEGSLCYVIDLAGSTRLTIVGRGERRPAAPSAILSIAIEQYVVVT